MINVALESPLGAISRPRRYPPPTRLSFDDDGLPLNEDEANEFAVRLIAARSETEFDHLLGSILTHAAARFPDKDAAVFAAEKIGFSALDRACSLLDGR